MGHRIVQDETDTPTEQHRAQAPPGASRKPSIFERLVAAEIRADLARRNMSAAQLAHLLGVSESNLGRKLRGIQRMDTGELDHIAEALGVPLHDLLEEALRQRDAEIVGEATAPFPRQRGRHR